MSDKLIPLEIRQRLHADMDRIFDLQEENAMLQEANATLNAEVASLRKNQRVRARPVAEEPANGDSDA